MTRGRTLTVILIAGALCGLARQAAAQPPAPAAPAVSSQTFAPLTAKLRGDESLTVTDVNGQRFKGRLTRISADQLTVLSRERSRTFRVSDVDRIEKRDTILNGLGIGAAAGALTAMLVVTNDCGADSECGFYESIAFYPLFGGGGAAIGAVVDALITKTLFTRTSGAVHLAVQPMPRGAALQVRMTF